MLLKDRKTGDVYELNIVNVVVECDINICFYKK